MGRCCGTVAAPSCALRLARSPQVEAQEGLLARPCVNRPEHTHKIQKKRYQGVRRRVGPCRFALLTPSGFGQASSRTKPGPKANRSSQWAWESSMDCLLACLRRQGPPLLSPQGCRRVIICTRQSWAISSNESYRVAAVPREATMDTT